MTPQPFNPLKRTGLKPRVLWLSSKLINSVKTLAGGQYTRKMGPLPVRSLSGKDKKSIKKLADDLAAVKDVP
jgi:hypothetical protein